MIDDEWICKNCGADWHAGEEIRADAKVEYTRRIAAFSHDGKRETRVWRCPDCGHEVAI